MSSARSITQAVCPPRAVFLDFPLGHTAGRVGDEVGNRAILSYVLGAFASIEQPGEIRDLSYAWSEDERWKEEAESEVNRYAGSEVGRVADERVERFDSPQYQQEDDRTAAETALARDGCPSCVFLD
jgi:hypothetical protein